MSFTSGNEQVGSLFSTSTFILPALLSYNCASAQPVKVIDADTGWTLQTQRVAPGGSLSDGAVVLGASSSKNLVSDCGEAGWLAYSCKAGPCKVPACTTAITGEFEVRRIGPPLSLIASFRGTASDLVAGLLTRKARQPVLLAARAGGSPNDPLLLQDGRGIHWEPALRRVLEGKYCFQVSPLAEPNNVKTFRIDWDRSLDPEGLATVSTIAPGGYRLEKGSGHSCAPDPEASPAWVVIAPASSFAILNWDWQKSTKCLDQLSAEGASASTVMTARQAVLTALAEIVERQ